MAQQKLLIVGDSLSAAFGLSQRQGWVQLLSERLSQRSPAYTVVNASISGDTTRSAMSRLPALLKTHRPNIVIVEIGANDGLRGLSLRDAQKNMQAMIESIHASHAKVLLIGMELPPNYGPTYTKAFHQLYQNLASHNSIILVPFLMAGFAENFDLMQADGIHPAAKAQPLMLENVWLYLQKLL